MELCSFLTLDSFITDPLTHEFMRKALLMSSLVAAVCGFLSSYLTLKGWALMGDAVSHSVMPGGQRKRTFLARAIAQRASILLLDEPFSGVDIRTEKLISELFIQFKNEGKTILLSTHDMIHVREFCDLVLLINKTVVAYGETSEVFTPENITTTFGGISPDFLFGPES